MLFGTRGTMRVFFAVFVVLCCMLVVHSEKIERRDAPLNFSLGPKVGESSADASSAAPASTGDAASAAPSSAASSRAPSSAAPSSSASSAASANAGDGTAVSNNASAPAASAPSSAGAQPSSSVDYPSITVPAGPSTSAAFNVMSAPASLAPSNASISANYSQAPAQATAAWTGPLPALMSQMYRGSNEALNNLPTFYWTLANASFSHTQLQQICDQQTHFCATSGCSDGDDTISKNFCDVNKGMATMCTCKTSYSRLPQYQWPVQMQDCLFRLQACTDACNNQRATPFTQRGQCSQACADQIGSSCGKVEQYGATYAVQKPGQTPSYHIVSQAEAQSAGARTHANLALVAAVSALAALWIA